MNVSQLFADEDAVSPVIGVILMVAITVILAAVIGTFVLGLGDNVQNDAPQANFQFSYGGDWDANTGTVDVTHNGGGDIDASNVELQVGGTTYSDVTSSTATLTTTWGSTVSTGSQLTVEEGGTDVAASGDDIRIVWQAPGGGSSNTIGSSTIP